jgi:cholesterol transport system auxiliary component
VLLLGGCSIKEVTNPIVKYSIDSSQTVNTQKSIDKILKVSHFKTSTNLLSENIWYKRKNFETSSYLYSSWSENFSSMIEGHIVDTLFKSGLFKSVFNSYSKMKYDFVLEGEITKAVQNVSKNGANVEFVLRLYLVDTKNSKLLSSKDFRYTRKCDDIDAYGAVKAYNDIIKKFDKEVILWLKKSIKEN